MESVTPLTLSGKSSLTNLLRVIAFHSAVLVCHLWYSKNDDFSGSFTVHFSSFFSKWFGRRWHIEYAVQMEESEDMSAVSLFRLPFDCLCGIERLVATRMQRMS